MSFPIYIWSYEQDGYIYEKLKGIDKVNPPWLWCDIWFEFYQDFSGAFKPN